MSGGTATGSGDPKGTQSKIIKPGEIRTMAIQIGKQSITIDVLVLESRFNYGRTDWQVAPVHGDGTAWVREDGLLAGTGAKATNPKGEPVPTYRGQGRIKGYAHREGRTDEEIKAMRKRGVVFEGDPGYPPRERNRARTEEE